MRVLVTGSAGKIGKKQVQTLLEAGNEVVGFDRTASKSRDWEHHCGDLRDLFAVRRAMQGVDAVVHSGALPHDNAGLPEDVLSVNVQGTLNILLASLEAGVERVINFSSVNALGAVGGHSKLAQFPIGDDYPRHPMTNYQLSKHLGEEACRSYSAKHGLITISLRPVYVIGENEKPHWMRAPTKEHSIGWFRNEFCAYVHVSDVCEAVMKSLRVQGVKNASLLLNTDSTGSLTPTEDLIRATHPEVAWATNRTDYFASNPFRSIIDSSGAKEILGWSPKINVRDIPE